MAQKAIILDRDGTIIIDKVYLNDPNQIEYLPRSFAALQMLRDAGYTFFIATNQSGVARGIVEIGNLYEIHRRIRADFCRHGVDILGFYYAPYMTDTDHYMRKPNPGMLFAAATDFNIDLRASWMIGDRLTDVEAGHRAGCKTVLLESSDKPDPARFRPPEIVAADLFEAALSILQQS